jgi:putative molybdopterin biosynthesis protein
VKPNIRNRLAEVRKSRGVGASDLARRVHVSRQTIYAIEAGTYVPNTEVALHLARELEVSVDDLFSLQEGEQPPAESIAAEVLSSSPPAKGQPVRICQIGSHWVGVPVSASPYYLPEADGIIGQARPNGHKADLVVFAKEEASQKRLVLAGCDPATGLLSRMVEKISGVEIVSAAASSKLALTWLKQGNVHIAGSHLEDPKTGEFNLPFIRREFPGEDFAVITFARWEEGLVVASGNPKKIKKVEDLARKNVSFVNRESGSGSRALLDQLLAKAGIDVQIIQGYDHVAYGHLAAAYCVVSREADACLATRSAAKTFDLDFIPLHSERYDLVMRRRTAELPAAQAFLDVLQRATLRRKLEVLAGYDTSQTGTVLA